jgi:hypothetical protein
LAVSLLTSYSTLAAEAYQEILHGDPHGAAIEDGTYNFKKRFIALSRAGKLAPLDPRALSSI